VVSELVWGDTYSDNAFDKIKVTDSQTLQTVTFGKWLKALSPAWGKKPCNLVNVDCDSSGPYVRQRESNGDFVHKEAYTALIHVSITGNPITSEHMGQVLGETDTTASNIQTIDVSQITATGSAKLLLAEIASESANLTENVKSGSWKASCKTSSCEPSRFVGFGN
jgi:hypothetical protein